MAYLVPGDFCDLNVFILDQMDHNIGTISACQVVDIPRQAIVEITDDHPGSRRPDVVRPRRRGGPARVARQRRRPPRNLRIAHLICELLLRWKAVGRVTGNSFSFPFTQIDIADTMGLSNVHVHRTLRDLRALGLIALSADPDHSGRAAVESLCGYNPNYLHLKNTRVGVRRSIPRPSTGRRSP